MRILKIGLIVGLVTGVLYLLINWSVQSNFKATYKVTSNDTPAKILLVWYRGIGEQETIARLKITAQRMGVELRSVSVKPPFYIRWFVKDPVAIAREQMQPDFLLTIQDWIEYYPGIPNYMTLTLGTERYITTEPDGQVKFINPEHAKFDALLPSFKDIDLLRTAYEAQGKKYQGFAWYPTAYTTEYESTAPNKLFYSGGFLWDTTRGSAKYKELFVMLDRAGYFAVCGPKKKWRSTPNSALGFIPVDGVALIQAQHNAGISLLLHTQLHLNGGAPTGRIFEAAAANTVIISDRHPFIEKYFGDNVLYIDIQQDAVGMFKQIDAHMAWIKANPQAAQTMAQNCKDIFMQNFSMEAQLARLIALHHEVLMPDTLSLANYPSDAQG